MNDKIDTMINDYFLRINNKSSQTFNWFKYLLMFASFLSWRGGWERGGASLKNWSKQSACTAVANEVATILVIFLTYFSPVVTHSPRKICRRCLEFCMHS